MTPKEKAKELYDKYEFVYIQNYTSKHEVKQCALLLIDCIIQELDQLAKPEYTIFVTSVDPISTQHGYEKLHYWEEVKEEVIQL